VFKLGVEGYILSIILSDIMSSLFISLIAENVHFISFKSVSKNLMSSMLKYSIPMIPTFILWWIVSASDKYMIRFMISDTENGLYSMATRIPTLISIVSTIFFQAWQLSAITEYNSEDSKRFYSTVFNAYQSILYIGSAGILLFLIPIAKVLLGDFHEAYIFAPLLIIAVLMSCLCQFLSSIYSATKNTSHSLWTSLLAAVNNIVLNLILIPRVGPQGAAFATMSSYGLCFIVRVFDTRKMLAYKVDWIKLILNITTLFIMCIVIVNEKKFLTLYLIACFAIIGLLNLDELNSTIKKLFRR
jgi:O-antigen/teichoic acid export membrane protein